MFRNYFKTAWRSIRKNKVYSFINIFGLTAGLTCFLLIALYIFDELTYDRFHKNADDIFRVVEKRTSPEGKEMKVVSIPFNVSAQGRKQFPEVMEATRFSIFGRTNVYAGDQQQAFYEPFNLADSSFLTVFDFPLLAGNRKTALEKPHT
jgi:putative ABC transport system permease protein